MKRKRKNFFEKNGKFLIILLVVIAGFGVLGYILYNQGFIQNIFNTVNQQEFNNPPSNTGCSFWFVDKEICAGDEATAHLKDGTSAMCRIAFKYNPEDVESFWTLYGDYTLNNNGELTLVNTPTITGDYLVRMICLDNEGRLCSDDDLLHVIDCGDSSDSDSDSGSSDCQGKLYINDCSAFTNEILCNSHYTTINSKNYECNWIIKLQSMTCKPSEVEC